MSTMPVPEKRGSPLSADLADASAVDGWEDGEQEPEFKPLTREQAQQWRASQPALSVWRLVGVQVLVGVLAGLSVWVVSHQTAWVLSVLYGAASVFIPTALMAYGLTSSALSRLLSGYARASFAGFLLWEGVKVLLVVAMLWSAPALIPGLNWLGLLVGLVLTLKVYWFGLWFQVRRPH